MPPAPLEKHMTAVGSMVLCPKQFFNAFLNDLTATWYQACNQS